MHVLLAGEGRGRTWESGRQGEWKESHGCNLFFCADSDKFENGSEVQIQAFYQNTTG